MPASKLNILSAGGTRAFPGTRERMLFALVGRARDTGVEGSFVLLNGSERVGCCDNCKHSKDSSINDCQQACGLALQCPPMLDALYFVYMVQSVSRRALYIGFTNLLISRVLEHRTRKYPGSFSAKYRTWRLVYYEEFGDSNAAFARERQLKGWSRAKKEALITSLNPHWQDLVANWEEKYGLEFRRDGRIVGKLNQGGWSAKVKTKDPSTPASRAGEDAREPSSAQDD